MDHVVFQWIVPIGNTDWLLKKQYIPEIFRQMEQIEKEFFIDVYLEDSFPLCIVPEIYRHFAHRCQWGISGISLDLYGNVAKCCAYSRYTIEMFLRHLCRIFGGYLMNWQSNRWFISTGKCRKCSLYPECGGAVIGE